MMDVENATEASSVTAQKRKAASRQRRMSGEHEQRQELQADDHFRHPEAGTEDRDPVPRIGPDVHEPLRDPGVPPPDGVRERTLGDEQAHEDEHSRRDQEPGHDEPEGHHRRAVTTEPLSEAF